MKKKPDIPPEDLARFDSLRDSHATLLRDTPLMPSLKRAWTWRGTMRLMKKIITLKTGTAICFDDIQMNGQRPWYKVHVKDSLISGWINSINFEGEGIG